METQSTLARSQSGSRHRRQVFWQIVLPVVLAAAGGIFLIVILSLATVNGSNVSAQWSSIATIWIVIPFLVLGLFAGLALAGMIFLIARLTHKLPTYTHLVHTYLQIIEIRTKILLNKVAQPQISLLSRWAAVKSFWKSLWRIGERL